MNELPSRGERYIDHLIDYRERKMTELATHSPNFNTPWINEALYYYALAKTPDTMESIEERQQTGIEFSGTVYQQESKSLTTQDPDIDISDFNNFIEPGYDNPIGKLS